MTLPHAPNSTQRQQSASPWPPLLAGVFFLLLYGRMTAPGIVEFFDDTLEFQLVLPTLGIAHPTGYPLYTLLGALWSRLLLPVGEWAWRVNLLSAVCAAAAVAAVAAVTQQVVLRSRTQAQSPGASRLARIAASPAWAAALAATAFGLGPVWSGVAGVAEVYALHNLFVALILWLSLRAATAAPQRQSSWLVALAFTIGLSLTHHRTAILLLPAVAIYLFWSLPGLRRPSARWLLYAAALLAPLLLYLYLPLRAGMGVHDLNAAYTNTMRGFLDHVLARRYAAFFGANPLAIPRTPAQWLSLAVDQAGWLVLGLAVIGSACGLQGRGPGRRAWALILMAGLTNLLFALFYRVGDVEVFLLPVWLCAAIAAGGGLDWLRGHLERNAWAALLFSALLIALVIAAFDGRGALVSRRDEHAAHDLALAYAAASFAPGSRVIGLEGEMTAIRYMQAAHGLAQGVESVVADDELLRRQRLDDSLAEGAPVYLTRELPGIAGDRSFSGEGGLVRVWPRGQAESGAPSHPIDLDVAEGALRLAGYDREALAHAQGRTDLLTLYWQPQQPLTQTLKVSLRLIDAGGAPWLQPDGTAYQQDSFPLRGVAPTTSWLPGEVVRDVYLVPHAPGTVIRAVVYEAESLAEVGVVDIPAPP